MIYHQQKIAALVIALSLCVDQSFPGILFTEEARQADAWPNLYPFGNLQGDLQLSGQPHQTQRVDLGFNLPYYGAVHNFTLISPNGHIAFGEPEWRLQPPYSFPNPDWPQQRDPAFIAAFYADADYKYVASQRISHVWYRLLRRSPKPQPVAPTFPDRNQFSFGSAPAWNPFTGQKITETKKLTPTGFGSVIDNDLLTRICEDIENAILGASSFTATHALIVTWENMAYGGSPRYTEHVGGLDVRKWQNTYQLVIATDELSSFAIFNYGHINWTTSNQAGGLGGKGGVQSALVGFNGGQGTGFYELPFSGSGSVYNLARLSPTTQPGRWVHQINDDIIAGGCYNDSAGPLNKFPAFGTMLGGVIIKIMGPCFTDFNLVNAPFDDVPTKCYPTDNHLVITCVVLPS